LSTKKIPTTSPLHRRFVEASYHLDDFGGTFLAAKALLAHVGPDRGAWATLLDHSLDLAEIAYAVGGIASHVPDAEFGTVVRDTTRAIANAVQDRKHDDDEAYDLLAMSLFDRRRLMEAIAKVDGKAAITADDDGNYETKRATVRKLAGIVKQVATIRAVGSLRRIKVSDGGTHYTLVGPQSGRQGVRAIALTDEALGDETQVNIPKLFDAAPTPDRGELEVSHNFTGRKLGVLRQSDPVVSKVIAAGEKLVIKASDLQYSYVLFTV